MTRYRERTRRFLILYLIDAGFATVKQMARDLGRDERVIRNYLQHFREDFYFKDGKWGTSKTVKKNKVLEK